MENSSLDYRKKLYSQIQEGIMTKISGKEELLRLILERKPLCHRYWQI